VIGHDHNYFRYAGGQTEVQAGLAKDEGSSGTAVQGSSLRESIVVQVLGWRMSTLLTTTLIRMHTLSQ
jgi:hypothetical protein